MMLTRCPACQTVFRLRAEQLRARHGEVRCGHCFHPFNALDQLIAEDAGRAPAPVAARSVAEAASPPAAHARAVAAPTPAADATQGTAAASTTHLEPPAPEAAPSADEAASPDQGETASGAPQSPAPLSAEPAAPAPPAPSPSTEHRRPTKDDEDRSLLSDLDFDIPDDLLSPPEQDGAPRRSENDGRHQEPSLDEIDFSAFFEANITPPPPDTEPESRLWQSPEPPIVYPALDVPAESSASATDADKDSATHAIYTATDHEVVLPEVIRAERRAAAHAAPLAGDAKDRDEAAGTSVDRADAAAAIAFNTARADNEVDTDLYEPVTAEIDPAHLDATYGKARASGARRTLWGLAVGLLAGTLAVQAVYLYRQDIARTLPGLRPLLVSACERLGCDMPLPRDAGLIAIETSDLQSEPGRGGRFVLHATVRNRAEYPQAWPHLELTLTDASDAPVARRVFEPHEWVAPNRLEAGFSPRGDAVVRQAFAVKDLAPVGYRVYVFYP